MPCCRARNDFTLFAGILVNICNDDFQRVGRSPSGTGRHFKLWTRFELHIQRKVTKNILLSCQHNQWEILIQKRTDFRSLFKARKQASGWIKLKSRFKWNISPLMVSFGWMLQISSIIISGKGGSEFIGKIYGKVILLVGVCANPPDWFQLCWKELNPSDRQNGWSLPIGKRDKHTHY